MKITKDPKIINFKVVDRVSGKTVSFDVGPTLGEVEGNIAYDGTVAAIEKGQVYQIQSYGDADPSNVTVKDIDGKKILVTGRDGSDLNNLDDVKTRFIGKEVESEKTDE
jgi:hypothetical protein